jgi:predicted RNA-binding Zn ribbon-like protein
MLLDRNVRRAAELAASLVNLATPGMSGGRAFAPLMDGKLTATFAAELGAHWSGEITATADAALRLVHLATGLRRAFDAEGVADACGVLNELIDRYRPRPYLTDDVDQPFHLHFHGQQTDSPVEALAGELTVALALIVDRYGAKRFGACQARDCNRVWVDLTRNGSRRYCSDACAARAKVAAYRSRQAGAR